MTRLSDTQLVILSAACQRPDQNLLPLPAILKGGAAQKVIGSLIAKGLVEEVEAGRDNPIWRTDGNGLKFTLLATNTAFQTLGIEPETLPIPGSGADDLGIGPEQADKAAHSGTGGEQVQSRPVEAGGAELAPTTRKASARTNSKQARLIAMLKLSEGASLDEIIAATGWQAHTVRGAIAGALKKKLGLTVASEKVEGRGRVYRIAG